MVDTLLDLGWSADGYQNMLEGCRKYFPIKFSSVGFSLIYEIYFLGKLLGMQNASIITFSNSKSYPATKFRGRKVQVYIHVENVIAEIGSLSTPSLKTKSTFVDLARTVAV